MDSWLNTCGEIRGFYVTQQEFADRVGVSQNYVSDMERSKVDVGAQILLRIEFETRFTVRPNRVRCSATMVNMKVRSWVECYSWSPSHDQCGMLRPFGTSSADRW
jgi:hypothetical protein